MSYTESCLPPESSIAPTPMLWGGVGESQAGGSGKEKGKGDTENIFGSLASGRFGVSEGKQGYRTKGLGWSGGRQRLQVNTQLIQAPRLNALPKPEIFNLHSTQSSMPMATTKLLPQPKLLLKSCSPQLQMSHSDHHLLLFSVCVVNS